MSKITAVIPVRKGSTRCKNKNIRNFEDTNLLKLKIEILKKAKGIDTILVSSNCDIMLGIAKDMGVNIHKRDEEYCTTKCSGSKFMVNLAQQVSTEYFLYSTCVTPLTSYDLIEKCINEVSKLDIYDSIVLANVSKNFMWDNNKPINYNLNNAPPSQELPEYYIPNFACCLINTKKVINYKNVIGKKPLFIKTDTISGLDIDENSDFVTAELLYKNNLYNSNICKQILDKRTDKISLIDCTIRDGGYLNNWDFSYEEVLDCYKSVTVAGCEYFEIGFRTNRNLLQNKGKWCYCNEDDINKITDAYDGCEIAVMAKLGTVSIDDFLPSNMSKIKLVRVLIARCTKLEGKNVSRYDLNDLKNARQFTLDLINLGYKVCINLGCGDIIDDEERENICNTFHDLPILCLYLADTYGGFNSKNIPIQFHKFYDNLENLESKIELGFHIHNNNGDGLEKAKTAIFHGCNFIDVSINGLGRGAGNLKYEEYLCHKYDIDTLKEKIRPIINFYDKNLISKKDYVNLKIQQHPYYNIAGKLSLHPDYINEILNNINTSVDFDLDIIYELDKFTKENNVRNYDKNLVSKLSNHTK